MNEFTLTLETWYRQHGRDLPWRRTTDPYTIWISEIILQQTRVAQGMDYFLRFIERFPNVYALAEANEDEVLRYWQGLGYYSRARNLHAAAQSVASKGGFPNDYASVRAMKGVGDYTAAAICSLAYGLPHAVVDGNVYRVLARYWGIDTPIDSTSGKKTFAALAQEMLDKAHPGLYNQAIMDFGAMVCIPKNPLCLTCPLVETCTARQEGRVEELPVKGHQTKVTDRYFHYIMVRKGVFFLLRQRTAKDIWQNLYEVPLIETPNELLTEQQLAVHPEWKSLEQLFTPSCVPLLHLLREEVVHILSHRRIHARFLALEAEDNEIPPPPVGYLWVTRDELPQYAVSRLITMLFEDFFQNLH